MRKYLLRPRSFVIVMVSSAIAVAIFGPSHNAFSFGLVVLLMVAATLLVTAAIEWRNRHPRPKPPNIIAVSVTRQDGRREIVSLNPDDDASIAHFTRALEADIALRTTPEEREDLRAYARAKVNRELASANRA